MLYKISPMTSKFEKTYQITLDTAIAPGCLPELEVKNLLLKTPFTVDTGLGGIELELTRSLCPEDWLSQYWRCYASCQERKRSIVLPAIISMNHNTDQNGKILPKDILFLFS